MASETTTDATGVGTPIVLCPDCTDMLDVMAQFPIVRVAGPRTRFVHIHYTLYACQKCDKFFHVKEREFTSEAIKSSGIIKPH